MPESKDVEIEKLRKEIKNEIASDVRAEITKKMEGENRFVINIANGERTNGIPSLFTFSGPAEFQSLGLMYEVVAALLRNITKDIVDEAIKRDWLSPESLENLKNLEEKHD